MRELLHEERLVFSQTFEGLFHKGLAARVTPRLEERLRAIGVDLQKLAPAYEIGVWAQALRLAAEEVYPELPLDEALSRLGEDSITGYTGTFLGQAVLGVLKVLGPKKALARMDRSFRSGNNYLSTRFTELGETEVELWFSEVHGQAESYAGIIRGAGRLMGAKAMDVRVAHTDGREARLRVRWEL